MIETKIQEKRKNEKNKLQQKTNNWDGNYNHNNLS